MSRIAVGVLLATLTSFMALPAVAVPPAAITAGGVSPTLDLKAQLEKGLKPRRPVEFAYIAEIVEMVENGEIPRSLVDSTFIYARHKPQRQIQYFQFALQTRAKRLGVPTPSLSNQAVILR